ncbi:MarR family winged helix-turn-helix transcriptional regulator [Jatrophihabitans sp. YIM 134969]
MTGLRLVFDRLVRFETEFYNGIDARLRAEHDLTLGRFETMAVIDRTPDCRVQDIADALAISIGAASKVTDRVEAAGHCRRRAHPGDGRSSIVELTTAGRRVFSRAGETFDDELRRRLADPLSPTALERFTQTLATLRAAHQQEDTR